MRRFALHRLLPLLALALVGASLASAAPAGATAVGINITTNAEMTSPKIAALIRASRPAWVRVFLVWSDVEPTQGAYSAGWIQLYQNFFASLPAATSVDVDVVGAPAWANGGSTSLSAPPVNASQYAGFLNYLVNTFHGRVAAWEIWNEEASPNWWTGTPAQYADLLKATYPAIKSADPAATVIVGANDPTFLTELYADGAGGYFDAVAVHTDTACNITSPYVYEYNKNTTTINQYFFLGFNAIHQLMVANGDGAKPIYMTEIGWASTSAECDTGAWAGQKLGGVSEATQATYLQEAYHCLAQPQYSYVKAAMWFEMANGADSTSPIDNYGLLNTDFSPKPAWTAWEQESLGGDQLTGTCGDFNGPAITILHPTQGQHYSGALRIAVSASSPTNGVREITIQLNKQTRVHFVAKNFPTSFSGSISWKSAARLKLGPHTIKVTVIDKLGNTSTATINVVHMRAPLHGRRHH
ncbi:MAG: Ig-like domain-containing protein [Solirubrobacteraceae bacterium]|jgi:Big-like domain-containing protein